MTYAEEGSDGYDWLPPKPIGDVGSEEWEPVQDEQG
jgi:hypothetical protein